MISTGILPGGGLNSYSEAVSANGAVIAGGSNTTSNGRATRWTAAGGLQNLGSFPDGSHTHMYAISADGSVMAGEHFLGSFQALRWTATGGLQALGRLPGGTNTFGRAVSADGSKVTGWTEFGAARRGFLWSAALGMQPLPNITNARPFAMSADGTMIVGDTFSGSSFFFAFRWRADVGGGAVQFVEPLSGHQHLYFFALDPSGRIAGGASGNLSVERAVVWTEQRGLLDLNTLLPASGISLTGWVLRSCQGISADGTRVAGNGTFNGIDTAFIVTGLPSLLHAPCPANFNGINWLTIQDLYDFLAAWFARTSRADLNASGDVTLQDLFDYLHAYFVGCP